MQPWTEYYCRKQGDEDEYLGGDADEAHCHARFGIASAMSSDLPCHSDEAQWQS